MISTEAIPAGAIHPREREAPLVTTSITIPRPLLDGIDAAADAYQVSRSCLVRNAIRLVALGSGRYQEEKLLRLDPELLRAVRETLNILLVMESSPAELLGAAQEYLRRREVPAAQVPLIAVPTPGAAPAASRAGKKGGKR